eukprot:TRINITY_DN16179_c0_g1_i1.p1 TRINITY_DN16179_c0_g1~~TRINITY_DN16179_c0_g1_i1.p1  ORF type:complete len:914 (-),score=141.05 TRINITY_DN16179_c0_g1_i1:103-2844(-)
MATHELATEIFHQLDINGDGKIQRFELKWVLKAIDSGSFSDAQIEAIFNVIDANSDSCIYIDEFLSWAFEATIDFEKIKHGLKTKESEVKKLRIVTGGISWLHKVLSGSQVPAAADPIALSGSKVPAAADSVAETSSRRATDKAADKQANADFEQNLKFIASVPLFRCLPPHEHPHVALALETVTFEEGGTVIQQGDVGDEFFVIQEGQASLTMRLVSESDLENQVTTLRVGDYFGENELLRDDLRTATVVATAELTCLKLTRAKFHELGLGRYFRFPQRDKNFNKMRAVPEKQPTEKTSEQKEFILNSLTALFETDAVVLLEGKSSEDQEAAKASLIEEAWAEEVKAGDCVLTLNRDNNYFYIVQAGSLVQNYDDSGSGHADPSGGVASLSADEATEATAARLLEPGSCFGWETLMYNTLSHYTVCAKEDSVLWTVSRRQFKEACYKVPLAKLERYYKYLDGVEAFNMLLESEKKMLASVMIELSYAPGQILYKQGETAADMYVLISGELIVEQDGAIVTKLQGSQVPIFGQGALLTDDVRESTVRVSPDGGDARCLSLDRASFDIVLGPLKSLLGTKSSNAESTASMPPREKIWRKNLRKIGLLGCGGFGVVELSEDIRVGGTYALKAVSKGYIVKSGMQQNVLNEKATMMALSSPFCIRLYETYNGVQSLYFLMEPALGGELYATYNRKGFHGSVKHAQFYLASALLALVHMHERRILYRAIKPEDILIDEYGNCKLCDFGLSKFVIGKTYTTCGTPEYFAPELIAGSGHNHALDWWCWGILLFELLGGHTPFESASPMQIYSKVMKGIDRVAFPASCKGPVEHLIKAMLRKDSNDRLACQPGGTSNIMTHAWYSGYDWDSHSNLTMEPPYRPVVKSKKDLSNFTARKEDIPRMVEYVDPGTGWDQHFAT